MSLIIYDQIEQGTPDWYKVRAGIATASQFHTVLASGRGGGESLTRAKYLRELAAEIITGEPTESFSNQSMERGKAMEAEARNFYALCHDVDPKQIGFIRNGDKGCSPDSLIGDDGALEIKTKKGDLLIDVLFKDKFPAEHVAQCQGVLWVAEREWIDLIVYWPKLPPFIRRAYRDELYIAKLAKAVAEFNEELQEIVERVKNYGSRAA